MMMNDRNMQRSSEIVRPSHRPQRPSVGPANVSMRPIGMPAQHSQRETARSAYKRARTDSIVGHEVD